jgi:hypothetical protein
MAVHVTIDAVGFEIASSAVSTRQLKEIAGLTPAAKLLRVTPTGLKDVSNESALPINDGDAFISISRRERSFFVFDANTIGALLAIAVSAYSIWMTVSYNYEQSEHDSINNFYRTYFEMRRTEISVPETMHIFVLPDSYDSAHAQVRLSVSRIGSAERSLLVIKERAMADYVFTLFEYTLYDFQSASKFGNRERALFEKDVLEYFTRKLLRNPRLLWYWDERGGKLSSEYEEITRQYYADHVLHDPKAPLIETPDPKGPLAE